MSIPAIAGGQKWETSPAWPYYGNTLRSPNLPSRNAHLRIAFFNDIHEKFPAFERIVGKFNRLSHEAQQQGLDLLKLSAGDWNAGKERNELELGARLTDMAGIQFAAMGNHELDSGVKAYAEALKNASFRTVATNLKVPKTSSLHQRIIEGKLAQGPLICTSANGIRYGIIGFTSPAIRKYMNPDANLEGVTTQSFEAGLQELQGDIDRLKQHGVDKIIALTHCDDEEDIEVAQRTKGLDVIIGGHSHNRVTLQLKSAGGEPVTLVKTRGNGREFGVLDLQWDSQGWAHPTQSHFYSPMALPEDPAAKQLIDSYLGPSTVIGRMGADVNTEDAATSGENGVANRVADVIRMATGADIALFRGTELRNDIHKGDFTDRDLRTLLPFSDKLANFRMSGAQILEALNESARSLQLESNHPGILHASGLRYTVDKQLGRVTQVLVQNRQAWEPLNLEKTYTVASGDFIAKNPSDYRVFKRVPMVQQFPYSLRDAFGQYVWENQGKPLTFPKDGRLQVIHAAQKQPAGELFNPHPAALSLNRPAFIAWA